MHHLKIDRLAMGSSPVHKLDPRTKLAAAIVYSLLVISVPPVSVAVLFVYAVGPFVFLTVAEVPILFVLRQVLYLVPFVAVLAVSSVWYDRSPVAVGFGPFEWETTAGVIRCVNIVLKFAITVSVLMCLGATTRFSDLTAGLDKLGVPSVLVMQLSFLYRYIFVLVDKAAHMLRARRARKMGKLPLRRELRIAGSLIGKLLGESIETAERVNLSMRARGFTGHFRLARVLKLGRGDAVFAGIFAAFTIGLMVMGRLI
ncbi:Energy-coupling factor transporter transmembrane protein CbiQ [Anaerohalosphaera lusitana]|uniref:Energy-coupling factor transporter transmembrane protein CbiQ n=1 Tax=Anaerohalosphaera lusitana TaxID=1936003 RepID=A0A1U9NKM5_9BACT|nr:cobalt ECF transporter T component CbiQ [Anaerohalosphaera lusitana]AQT68492.1 Energy-coupling factor transporter transmembrane protein CbiQ [Anaerohalosphaera lusitana]